MATDKTGWTKRQREARRQMYDGFALQQAKERERSIKCSPRFGRHATDPDGCRNNGSTCLCECHDPEEGRS
jgi:hypothetical protein